MRNKRGALGSWVAPLVLLVVIGASMALFGASEFYDKASIGQGSVGFEDLITTKSDTASTAFSILNFIFGKVPQVLLDLVGTDGNPYSAMIVLIAMWFVFFLIFGDIMKLYGGFSPVVNWVVAALIVVVGANLNIISNVMVFFLAFLAVFGTFSIIASLALVFIMFILFHFGTSGFREAIINRRAEDEALRVAAGASEAASGLAALRKVSKAAKKK